MKKKIISVLLTMAMGVSLMACGGGSSASAPVAPAGGAPAADSGSAGGDAASSDSGDADYRIAMITDSGDVTDMSFNQNTYEAAKAFSESAGKDFQYYKPTEDTDDARIASFNNAVADGYNVIITPGYLFSNTIINCADANPDVKIIGLDLSEGDFPDYTLPENVACFNYKEELPGYMAGYAAVKEGYKKLGFLGGMAVPAVIRYGYGFVQGADAAAREMGIEGDVSVNYVYGGQFFGDEAITAMMDTWYAGGTEIVFACGGGIWTSAGEAAAKVGGKVIGVDVDQTGTIDGLYGDGTCVTSAMKGLYATVTATLTDLVAGEWSKHAGNIESLGIISANPEENYVGLPTDTWRMENFTEADYNQLVADMADGKITVSDSVDAMPATAISVEQFDNIH